LNFTGLGTAYILITQHLCAALGENKIVHDNIAILTLVTAFSKTIPITGFYNVREGMERVEVEDNRSGKETDAEIL
jgi:hypothetical protein